MPRTKLLNIVVDACIARAASPGKHECAKLCHQLMEYLRTETIHKVAFNEVGLIEWIRVTLKGR